MVDRILRDRLADAIHALVSGFITNDEFEDGLWEEGIPMMAAPTFWPDAAIGPIGEAAWLLYSDTRRYRLTGRNKLSRVRRRKALRWVLFLRTDLEYEWSLFRRINPALVSISGCLESMLSFGRLPSRRLAQEAFAQWRRVGDYGVWPFFRREDYEATCRLSCPFTGLRPGAAVRLEGLI